VDDFYYRFTTPRSNSLILGSSRAAQGIKPEVINQMICTDESCKIINHSFAGGPSSIGPNYLREIEKKLIEDSRNGLFIFSVNPWNLTTTLDNVEDDSLEFFEVKRKLFVGNLKSSSVNPNLEYLWTHWNNKFSVFENVFKHSINYGGILQLHADGWLEVNIPMDSVSVRNRIITSTNGYIETSRRVKWSDTRFYFFEKIIKYLQTRGEVYLVRMPVSRDMYDLEQITFPDFNEKMNYIVNKYDVPFINFIEKSGSFVTTDTHHLWKKESERISYDICDSIMVIRDRRLTVADSH
jgi:hypothetical protein